MNADGTKRVRLSRNAAFDGSPTWSPDGTKIAFESTRSGNYDIWWFLASSADVTQATSNKHTDRHPDWQAVIP
jgi:TolB protein